MERYNPYQDQNQYRSTFNFSDTTSVNYSNDTLSPASEPPSEKPSLSTIPDEKASDSQPSRPVAKLQAYFDRAVPPHKRYLGHSRQYCVWVTFAVVSALFVFFLGVGVAVTRGRSVQTLETFETGTIQHGKISHYTPIGPGACGSLHGPETAVAAIGEELWLQKEVDIGNSSMNKHCGRQLVVTKADNKTINHIVTVVDRCRECAPNHLELSNSAFSQFSPLNVGEVLVDWHFIT